jgi:hypothetical protein
LHPKDHEADMLQPSGERAADGPNPAPAVERREVERHPCHIRTVGRGSDSDAAQVWAVTITEISPKGAALVPRHRVKPGIVPFNKLQGADLRLSRPVPARVMHARQHEGGWLHGCAFLRQLRDDDLEGMLFGGD